MPCISAPGDQALVPRTGQAPARSTEARSPAELRAEWRREPRSPARQRAEWRRERPQSLVVLPEGAVLLARHPAWKTTTRSELAGLAVCWLLVAVAIWVSFWPMVALFVLGAVSLSMAVAYPQLLRWLRGSLSPVGHRFAHAAAVRDLRRWQARPAVPEVDDGGWIRVRGRVIDSPGFVSAGGRPNCVLAHYLGLPDGWESIAQSEVQAMPSCWLLVGEQTVELELSAARYLERSLDVDAQLQEDTIAVGDDIEVLGHVRRRIDPSTGVYRTPGLRLVLGSDGSRPLIVHRLP